MGKKLLFCGSAGSELSREWNDEGQYKFLPNEVLLSQWRYDEFKEKVDILLEIDDDGLAHKTLVLTHSNGSYSAVGTILVAAACTT